MKKFLTVMTTLAVLASCTNQNGLGFTGSGSGAGGGQGGLGAGGGYADGVGDPSSITYFNQTIGDTVRFTVDSSTLTQEARNILVAQAQWLRQSNARIQIEGHADEQGTREYNLALGARRAASVRDFLMSQGIGAERISVVTYGKERPLAVCSDENCWSQNRRAVTVVQ